MLVIDSFPIVTIYHSLHEFYLWKRYAQMRLASIHPMGFIVEKTFPDDTPSTLICQLITALLL